MAALQRAAVAETLEEHLIDSKGFYQLPVGRLARSFSAAGAAVPDLIRSSGSPLPSDARAAHGFVELVGAGVLPAPWLALRSDSVTRLDHQIAKRPRLESSNEKASCERLKVFSAVGETLVKREARWKNLSRVKGMASPLLELPEGCVLVCREADAALFQAFSETHTVVGIPGESLFHEGMEVLISIRTAYGEGWLQGIRSFQAALEGARKETGKTPYVVVPELADAAERASVTALELLGAGWVPMGWRHETEKGSGIYLFRNVSFLDFWGGQLAIHDRRQRRLACAESFESRFAQDRVFLAFKGLNYTNSAGSEQNASSKWFVFPELPFNAFNVVVRLLPGLRLTVVGYRAGSPRTSEAGVFERVLRFRRAKETLDHRLSRDLVTKFIEWLLEERRPANILSVAPLEICDVLEAAESKIEAEQHLADSFGVPSDTPGDDFGALTGPFRLVWHLLLGLAERTEIPSVDQVAEEVLGVPSSALEHLKQKMPAATPVSAYSALRESDRVVKECLKEEDSNKKRNRQRYPLLKLNQQCLHMVAWTFYGILGVPMFLSEWLAKRCRFVAILPLDSPIIPGESKPTCRTRHVVGGWRSWEAYAYLFSSEATDGSVRIDVSPLLEHALLALQTTPLGWLVNKCSETNELILSLMRRRGYVSNFDLYSLPRRIRSPRDLLDSIDGRLLVRCLQSTADGSECMVKWVERVASDCQTLLGNCATESIERSEDPITNYLSVFRDVEGIVAAALDAARAQLGPSIPRVYLELELLRKHFQAEVNVRSNAREYNEGLGNRPAFGDAEDSACTRGGVLIEDRLRHLLEIPNIRISRVVDTLKVWEETEGQQFGESIDGLLADIDQEIEDDESRARATGDENLRRSRTETVVTLRRNLERLIEEMDLVRRSKR